MPSTLNVELVEQTPTALQLRLWRDDPNAPRTRTLELAEIAALIGKAETDYYSPLPAKLEEVGRTLFRWLDGGERWLTAEIQASNPGDVLVLAIAMPHGLAHLPWEVLHDGTGFLIHTLNPPVLPVRWRKAPISAHPVANRPLQALFMASSPEDVQPCSTTSRRSTKSSRPPSAGRSTWSWRRAVRWRSLARWCRRREEELPVYERLADVRERALTLGKIADVLASRGELDEALRIRRDEELPVYAAPGARRRTSTGTKAGAGVRIDPEG